MAVFSCSHPNQAKHTVSFASSYKHAISSSGGDKYETLWRTEWYLKWGWFPTPREVLVHTNKRLDC